MNGAELLGEVLDAVLALPIDDRAKARCLQAVYSIGLRNDVRAIVVREREEYAVYQLAKGVDRTVIRDRLVRTYGISARHAVRVIGAALQTGHRRAGNVSAGAHNRSEVDALGAQDQPPNAEDTHDQPEEGRRQPGDADEQIPDLSRHAGSDS